MTIEVRPRGRPCSPGGIVLLAGCGQTTVQVNPEVRGAWAPESAASDVDRYRREITLASGVRARMEPWRTSSDTEGLPVELVLAGGGGQRRLSISPGRDGCTAFGLALQAMPSGQLLAWYSHFERLGSGREEVFILVDPESGSVARAPVPTSPSWHYPKQGWNPRFPETGFRPGQVWLRTTQGPRRGQVTAAGLRDEGVVIPRRVYFLDRAHALIYCRDEAGTALEEWSADGKLQRSWPVPDEARGFHRIAAGLQGDRVRIYTPSGSGWPVRKAYVLGFDPGSEAWRTLSTKAENFPPIVD